MTRPQHAALLAAVVVAPAAAAAQRVPGRDLLDFPLGTIAEAPALAGLAGGGLHNPAALVVPAGHRLRLTAAQLNASVDQGVTGQVLSVAVRAGRRDVVSLSIARSAVSDLLRTGDDPTTLGRLDYAAAVVSAAGARRLGRHLTAGAALRYRHGRADTLGTGVLGGDVGIVADGLTRADARLGLSSYLWRPNSAAHDRPGVNAAVDVRLVGTDAEHEARGGYSYSRAGPTMSEHYLFAAGRLRNVEGRLGSARSATSDGPEWRTRLALGLHYARFSLGVAREQAGAVLDPQYQFTISSVFK